MASKTSYLDMAKADYLLVGDEIAYSNVGYCLLRQAPVSLRPVIFEDGIYRLQQENASRIMLGLREPLVRVPRSLNFGAIKTAYSYAMLLMGKRIPARIEYANRLRFLRVAPTQIDEYWALHNSVFEGIDNASFSRRSDIEECVHKENYEVMFACDADTVIGICEYEILARKRALINTVGVDARYRGLGYGRDILANASYALRSQGATQVELVVSSTNSAAIGLYKSEGFRKKETISRWYEFIEA